MRRSEVIEYDVAAACTALRPQCVSLAANFVNDL